MSSINRVQHVLQTHQVQSEIINLDDNAHTAQQAANALGCEVAQIVKSLIFKTGHSEQAVLALISGDKRLNPEKLEAVIGQSLEKADAGFVKAVTGFSIGGVAPVGSLSQLPTYMDQDLLKHNTVWAAAGHPKSVFEINPDLLQKITGAQALGLTNGV